jgi:hypothetical protein
MWSSPPNFLLALWLPHFKPESWFDKLAGRNAYISLDKDYICNTYRVHVRDTYFGWSYGQVRLDWVLRDDSSECAAGTLVLYPEHLQDGFEDLQKLISGHLQNGSCPLCKA